MNARPSLFWSGVFAVMLMAAIGYWCVAPRVSQGGPPLAPVSDTLRIGPVNPSSEYKHILRIRNNTNEPVEIEEFVSSCTCAGISPSRVTVPARGEASVSLTLDLVRYVTPGREATIRGKLHVAPVVLGKRLDGWPVAIEITRPKILVVPAGEINFGTVYQGQSAISSQHLVFVFNDMASENVTVQTTSSSIHKIGLEPVSNKNSYYRTYKLGLALPDGRRPYGLERFTITVSGPGGTTLEIPSQICFDSGLRLHVDELPPTIIRQGDDIRWSMRVYRIDGDLSSIDVAIQDESQHSSCTATKERLGDGTWRVDCLMTARAAGNIACKCQVAGILDSGERVVTDEIFRFYVLRSAKKL